VVGTAQLIASVWPAAATALQSHFGSFIQAAIVAVSFAPITSSELRRQKKRRALTARLHSLLERVLNGKHLHCEELQQAYQDLSIVKAMHAGTYSDLSNYLPQECAIFILGHQYFGHSTPNAIDSTQLTLIAARAALDPAYRRVLTADGLSSLVPGKADLTVLTNRIEATSRLRFPVTSRQAEADARFEHELTISSRDDAVVVSTTSQNAFFLADILSRREQGLRSLRLAYLSPFILTHNAIRSHLLEATVPRGVIPTGQQLMEPTVDAIRRVIRILIGLERCLELFQGSTTSVRVLLLTDRHPGVKIRLLRHAKYLQLFPGNLNYANNLYRFGSEITDRQGVDQVVAYLDKWLSCATNELLLDRESVDETAQRAVNELALYLTGTPRVFDLIHENYQSLLALLAERRARELLQRALAILAEKYDNEGLYREIGMPSQYQIFVRTSGQVVRDVRGIAILNGPMHVSAGWLVRDTKGRVLVVEKRTKPNVGKWSIPAGHCEWGESPLMAALRELSEEVGLSIDRPRLVLVESFDEIFDCRHGVSQHLWYLYDVDLPVDQGIVMEREELSNFKWADVDSLREMSTQGELTIAAARLVSLVWP
jgi:ADP-ribose pyrophosphatase YjhB (NUDIX family)